MSAPLSVGGDLVDSSLSDPEREQWVEPVWFDPHPLPENLQASIDAGDHLQSVEVHDTRDLTRPLDLLRANFPYLAELLPELPPE